MVSRLLSGLASSESGLPVLTLSLAALLYFGIAAP
jgi:hypothetical protein